MKVRQHSNPQFFRSHQRVEQRKAAVYLDGNRRFRNRRFAIRSVATIAFVAFSTFVFLGVH